MKKSEYDACAAAGAKNVILIIGDGMGDSEITIGRNYLKGAGGFLVKSVEGDWNNVVGFPVWEDGLPIVCGPSAHRCCWS